jgi:hypothetical protein
MLRAIFNLLGRGARRNGNRGRQFETDGNGGTETAIRIRRFRGPSHPELRVAKRRIGATPQSPSSARQNP